MRDSYYKTLSSEYMPALGPSVSEPVCEKKRQVQAGNAPSPLMPSPMDRSHPIPSQSLPHRLCPVITPRPQTLLRPRVCNLETTATIHNYPVKNPHPPSAKLAKKMGRPKFQAKQDSKQPPTHSHEKKKKTPGRPRPCKYPHPRPVMDAPKHPTFNSK